MEIAEILTGLDPEEALSVLSIVGKIRAAEIFKQLPATYQIDICELLDTIDMAELLRSLASDDRVDLLKALPEEKFKALMSLMAKDEGDGIKRLAQFAEGTAGSIMASEFIALDQAATVREALERFRLEGATARSTAMIFVVDGSLMLKGSIALADLILADPEKKLCSIMNPRPQSINALSGRLEAINKFSRYDLVALPVVDAEEAMIGLITHDDMVDAMEQEQAEEMERFIAITGSHEDIPYLHTSIWLHFRNRVGWLFVLAIAGLLAGAVIKSFKEALAALMILIFYMPMLAAAGGNSASQSAALVLRSLKLREIVPKDAFSVIWKEARVALLLGLALGLLTFGCVVVAGAKALIPGSITILDIGIAIGIALALQVTVSTILGAGLPFGAALLGIDPAFVASPLLAAVADVIGLLIYFTTARMILRL